MSSALSLTHPLALSFTSQRPDLQHWQWALLMYFGTPRKVASTSLINPRATSTSAHPLTTNWLKIHNVIVWPSFSNCTNSVKRVTNAINTTINPVKMRASPRSPGCCFLGPSTRPCCIRSVKGRRSLSPRIKVAEEATTTQAMVAPTRRVDLIKSMSEASKMCRFVVRQVVYVWVSCIW
jgi:hypothetical protein